MTKKRCFVIQGFGKKTDFQTGRVLDLDASYEVIKEAVEAAGLECIRADEIQHSGTIETPMYEQIQEADLVVADLSTSNVNAAYELGVRHGLRRKATIIVAEKEFAFPFDVNHIAIRTYEHLGSDLGRREAKRFRDDLKEAIEKILAADRTDSPVYTFLPALEPPRADGEREAAPAAAATEARASEESVRSMVDEALQCMKDSEFGGAKRSLRKAIEARPNDDYLKQQLALATYKSEKPSLKEALLEARGILADLGPMTSHDTETLGMWGSVHKQLWDLDEQREHLDTSIFSYERGFHMAGDYYNGINFAYLLNVRSKLSDPADAITDFVFAQRVRAKVAKICESLLKAEEDEDAQFWIVATLWEAAVGIGNEDAAKKWKAEVERRSTVDWMIGTCKSQIEKLEKLLESSPLSQLGG